MSRVKAVFSPCASSASSHRLSLCVVAIMLLASPAYSNSSVYVEKKDLALLVGETGVFHLTQDESPTSAVTLKTIVQHTDVINVAPETLSIASAAPSAVYDFSVFAKNPGYSEITFNVTSGEINASKAFVRVGVMISRGIYILSYIIGWIYFLAWTVSFYPQIYTNYTRKSVVGLNFDFVTLNIMGFTMYSFFNCGLYFSSYIQSQYFDRYPRGHNPVQLNDVFFSVHAAFATLTTIIQCMFYERAQQRVSTVARCILGAFVTIFIITGILAASGVMLVLDFLYACSYIKLTITFIKYVPQAYMNYKRKSTIGWSIGNIFLDFTGGLLSIVQMMLNAWNYDDWASFFGDFTKFGLGMFSLCFDILFLLQHYYFYRDRKEFMMVNGSDEDSDNSRAEEKKEYVILLQGEKEEKTMYEVNGKA